MTAVDVAIVVIVATAAIRVGNRIPHLFGVINKNAPIPVHFYLLEEIMFFT